MENESKPAGSKRMEILQQSLAKKQTAFDNKLQAHFEDMQSANGQPHYSEKIIDRLAAHHGSRVG